MPEQGADLHPGSGEPIRYHRRRWSLGDRKAMVVRAVAAPLVLLVVLASHVSARWTQDLTPWKGGGFGMFSTVDSPNNRIVRVELSTDVGILPVAIPSGLGGEASAVRAAPSTGRLVGLAQRLAEQWWVVPDVASLAGLGGSVGEEEAQQSMAAEALTRAVAADAVRAVEPARFDGASQRRLVVHRVTVAVLRLDVGDAGASRGGPVLTPEPIRAVTLNLVPQDEAAAL